jgi:hypothetical protein
MHTWCAVSGLCAVVIVIIIILGLYIHMNIEHRLTALEAKEGEHPQGCRCPRCARHPHGCPCMRCTHGQGQGHPFGCRCPHCSAAMHMHQHY